MWLKLKSESKSKSGFGLVDWYGSGTSCQNEAEWRASKGRRAGDWCAGVQGPARKYAETMEIANDGSSTVYFTFSYANELVGLDSI